MQMTTTTNSSKQMNITGAEAIIHCLLAEGVDLIYGYPGGAIMPVYDELYKFQDKLTHILTRHEQGATHAAQGYARVSGKVGVAIATSGPGATNLVTGLADAQIDSTPMVCITGQVGRHLLGTDAFQETDIIGISTPIFHTRVSCARLFMNEYFHTSGMNTIFHILGGTASLNVLDLSSFINNDERMFKLPHFH